MWFSLQLARKAKDTLPAQLNQRSKTLSYTFVISLIFTTAIVSLYILSERSFYWWDYSTYSEQVNQKFADFLRAPFWALQQTWWSTNKDYSDYPTLLLLPFRALLGDSRLVYILSLAIVYLLPLALSIGAIATQLIQARSKLVYWSSLVITFLTPVFWAPTLRGYVDAGGALLVSLAVLVYLRDRSLTKRWQIVTLGIILGFLPLFRRHFLYAGIAFFLSMLLQATTEPWQQWKPDNRLAKRYVFLRLRQVGWVGLASLVTLLVFGTPFVVRLFTTDFSGLYSAYEVPLSQGLQYYGTAYGWIACLLAALGFAIAHRIRLLDRAIAAFVIPLYGFTFLLWVLRAKVVGVHYTTHFTPLIVLGLVALFWGIERSLSGHNRFMVRLVLGISLAINALIGFVPSGLLASTPMRPTQPGMTIQPMQQGTKLSELLSANYAPLRRSDYSELVKLTRTLQSLTPNQEAIYVGGASGIFNTSLLKNADVAIHHSKILNFLPVGDIDTRDNYPIQGLLQADYLVIASPFQHNIRPEDQEIVKIISDIFNQKWAFSKDFKKLPDQFKLDQNVTVNLYQRVRETSFPVAVQTLQTMKTQIGSRPGGQLDWVALNHDPGFFVWRGRDRYYIHSNVDRPTGKASFLYLEPPFPQEAVVQAKLEYQDRTCPGMEFQLEAIDPKAQSLYRTRLTHSPDEAANITLAVPTNRASYLTLELVSLDRLHAQRDLLKFKDANRCQIRLSDVKVSSGQ
jgi:hypothetical protein